jgi:hypothetical protein
LCRWSQVAPLAPPDGVAQDDQGNDGQRRDPVDADAEGEGGVERFETQEDDEK